MISKINSISTTCITKFNLFKDSFFILTIIPFFVFLYTFSSRICTTRIMYKNTYLTHKVRMAILNLKVKDFNWFVIYNQVYTLDNCSVPILCIYYIARIQIASIYPTFSLYLERMCFGTLYNFSIDIKFSNTRNLINCCYYLFLCKFLRK